VKFKIIVELEIRNKLKMLRSDNGVETVFGIAFRKCFKKILNFFYFCPFKLIYFWCFQIILIC
jgi:hypothetical protein